MELRSTIMVLSVSTMGVFLGGCLALPTTPATPVDDPRPCAQNFKAQGSFLAGQQFSTFDKVGDVSKTVAIERAARYMVKTGWTLTVNDSKSGIISASQSVSYGEGKTVPLGVVVTEKGSGVLVEMSYTISGGLTSPTDAIINQFCSTIEAIAAD